MRRSGRGVIKLFGGNRDNAAISGSRCSNWNNAPWNSNWNIGLRAACDDQQHIHLGCYGAQGGPSISDGQHTAAGLGKHTARFGERRVG